MKGNNMASQVPNKSARTTNSHPRMGDSPLMIKDYSPSRMSLVAEIELRPDEKLHTRLGDYPKDGVPKGFTIHVSPDSESDSVDAQIVRLETEKGYRFLLYTVSYSDRLISVEIWEL